MPATVARPLAILAAAVVLGPAACSDEPDAAPAVVYRLDFRDIDSPSSESIARAALLAVEGVESVEISYRDDVAIVTGDREGLEEALRVALMNGGFRVTVTRESPTPDAPDEGAAPGEDAPE